MTKEQIKERLQKIVEISNYAVLVLVGGQNEYDHSLDTTDAILRTREALEKLIKELT